ncbi:YdeI family protein, partial [Cupriavidus sp. 2MCAB6]|uniref:YdeI/OmpD-associated family protein n=1 Tax=Cupriavidus sp. 2MCAB6 TaxID=3232981 RepID=UPI003F8F0703
VQEAMLLNEQRAKVAPRRSSAPAKAVVASPAFVDRLAASPSVKTIFESKSTSFQKEYVVWIADAKTEATRDKRIDEALAWIAEGKGRFWKYAKGG